MNTRSCTVVTLAATASLAAAVRLSPPASAEPGPQYCPGSVVEDAPPPFLSSPPSAAPNGPPTEAACYTSIDQGSTTLVKQGCPSLPYPDVGIAALGGDGRDAGGTPCIDLAGTARPPDSADPTGLVWVPLVRESVTYARESGTHVPASLTPTQLRAVYSCDSSLVGGPGGPVTEDQIGGAGTDPVAPVIPQAGSATRAFFLAQIGVSTLGSCVQPTDNSVEPNEGTNPIFGKQSALDTRDVVFPYSVAAYLSQTVHGDSDQFDNPGPLVLGAVSKIDPTRGSGSSTASNPKFPFVQTYYLVSRNAGTKKTPAIPSYLRPLVGNGNSKGLLCSAQAISQEKDRGLITLGKECGSFAYTT